MPWREPPTSSRLVLAARIGLLLAPPALVVAAGVAAALHPPPSVADVPLTRYAWSLALLLGGVLVLVAMVTRRPRSQLAGRALIAGGAGFYAVHLATLPAGLPAAGLIGAMALGVLGELYRQLDLVRWRRADRDRSRRRHPAAAGR